MSDEALHEGREESIAGGVEPLPAPADDSVAELAEELETAGLIDEALLITPPAEPHKAPQLEPLLTSGASSEDSFDAGPGFAGPGFQFAEPYVQPQFQISERPVSRNPNFADASLFLVLLTMGLLVTTSLLGAALYFHWLARWFGLKSLEEAAKNTPIALGTQLLIYTIALVGAVPFFRMIWGKGYFDGLHWHGPTAFRLRYRLVATAFLCNVLAMLGNWLLPFPQHAPIDKLFSTSSDAWLLSCFGVTIAPFFEEMIFRGFLLPAVATAWDWIGERSNGHSPRPLDAEGNPVWSAGAMVFASLLVSVPFALMHSAQLGQAWGPLLLLYCISLILCAVRLATRSLAASTLVHSAYNFMLFAVMFAQTSGFRHMDKM
jgi:membrane protease YdiL (CAAX protease family)